jgi:hypothetical protein
MIDGAIVKPITFQGFTDCIQEAQSLKVPKTFEARIRRLRLQKQVEYFANGTPVNVGVEDISKMPIPAARLINAVLDDGEGKVGKIIRDGDGIDKSIIYELGTPIAVGGGKEPIKELEFHAQTFGEIEDVMAAPDSLSQTTMLIATIAKPVGGSLTQLPSWAVAQISVADGVQISRLVTPRFLESPDE